MLTMQKCDWLTQIKNAKKSCLMQNNLKKVHYLMENGKELVEEYNTDTGVLTRRAWKIKTELGGEGTWSIEIGDPEPTFFKEGDLIIKENSSQPVVSRRITKLNLEWRIRNLPYPLETYSVTADPESNCLTVRTTNKKYFKKLSVPELERVGICPEQKNISFSHKYNTLIITYKKPQEVLDLEKAVYEIVKDVKPKNEGEMDCKPS